MDASDAFLMQSDKFGTPFIAQDIEQLPVRRRQCRDVASLALAGVFAAGLVAIMVVAAVQAGGIRGYRRLTHGFDMEGRVCGLPTSAGGAGTQYPYLYWPTPMDSSLAVCVRGCPTAQSASVCAEVRGQQACWRPYATKPALDHFCVPSGNATIQRAFNGLAALRTSSFSLMVADLGKTWPLIALSGGMAVALGYTFLLLVQHCTIPLLWSAITFVVGGMAAGGVLCIVRGVATGPPSALSPSDADRFDVGMASAGATLLLLAGAMVLLVYSSRRSIRVAAACVSEAAAAVSAGGLPLLALPAIKTLLCLVVTAFFMTATVYLMAAGEVVPGRWVSVPGISGPVQTRTVRWNSTLRACFLLQAFGWVWAVGALWAAGDFVVAYAVSSWYFHTTDAQQTDSGASRRVWRGMRVAGRYHAGSFALGGLLQALLWSVRLLVAYLRRQLRSREATHRVLRVLLACVQTCLSCMQAQLRFVQSHAYVHMAIFGASFCRSARSAFHLLARHAGALGALYGISTVLRIIGCSLVCCVPTLAVYVALTANGAAAEVYSPVLPVLVVAALCLAVGGSFTQVLDTSVAAVLQCYAIDCDAHGEPRMGSGLLGSVLKPDDAMLPLSASYRVN